MSAPANSRRAPPVPFHVEANKKIAANLRADFFGIPRYDHSSLSWNMSLVGTLFPSFPFLTRPPRKPPVFTSTRNFARRRSWPRAKPVARLRGSDLSRFGVVQIRRLSDSLRPRGSSSEAAGTAHPEDSHAFSSQTSFFSHAENRRNGRCRYRRRCVSRTWQLFADASRRSRSGSACR